MNHDETEPFGKYGLPALILILVGLLGAGTIALFALEAVFQFAASQNPTVGQFPSPTDQFTAMVTEPRLWLAMVPFSIVTLPLVWAGLTKTMQQIAEHEADG